MRTRVCFLLITVLATLAVQFAPSHTSKFTSTITVLRDGTGPVPPWRDGTGPVPPWIARG
jgi:hypothetical protein